MAPGGGEQVGDELGADGDAGAVFAVLAGVPVVGHHHRDPGRRGPLERVNHHQKLHQVLVHRIAGGLHHKHIHSAHVLEKLEVDFAVGKALQLGLAHLDPDVLADLLGQRPVGGAGEELEALVLAQVAGPLALGSRLGILGLWNAVQCRNFAGLFQSAFLLLLFRRYRHRSRFHFRVPPSWLALAASGCMRSKNLAGRPGFEPGQVPPKGTVLPLDDRPACGPDSSSK